MPIQPLASSRSEVQLLGQSQGIFDLYAEVPDGASQLAMAKQKLTRPQVACLLVYESHLCSPEAVGSIGQRIKVDHR